MPKFSRNNDGNFEIGKKIDVYDVEEERERKRDKKNFPQFPLNFELIFNSKRDSNRICRHFCLNSNQPVKKGRVEAKWA